MTDLPNTRHSLLIRLADRCDDAWSEFLGIYENAIIDYARRRGLQDADARDVTQQVLASVEKKLQVWDTSDSRGSFRGWLFRAAHNIAVDTIKRSARAPQTGGSRVGLSISAATKDHGNASDEFLQDYRKQLFHWAAKKVRPQVSQNTWQAFWLTAVRGLKVDEVALQLGLTSGNVYAAKFRVTTRIQKMAARFQYTDEPSDMSLEQE